MKYFFSINRASSGAVFYWKFILSKAICNITTLNWNFDTLTLFLNLFSNRGGWGGGRNKHSFSVAIDGSAESTVSPFVILFFAISTRSNDATKQNRQSFPPPPLRKASKINLISIIARLSVSIFGLGRSLWTYDERINYVMPFKSNICLH